LKKLLVKADPEKQSSRSRLRETAKPDQQASGRDSPKQSFDFSYQLA